MKQIFPKCFINIVIVNRYFNCNGENSEIKLWFFKIGSVLL